MSKAMLDTLTLKLNGISGVSRQLLREGRMDPRVHY